MKCLTAVKPVKGGLRVVDFIILVFEVLSANFLVANVLYDVTPSNKNYFQNSKVNTRLIQG